MVALTTPSLSMENFQPLTTTPQGLSGYRDGRQPLRRNNPHGTEELGYRSRDDKQDRRTISGPGTGPTVKNINNSENEIFENSIKLIKPRPLALSEVTLGIMSSSALILLPKSLLVAAGGL
nr:uncharacterized protein CTRU02_15133 [Colletotrichum truncatum]KAF6781350.1 hypothetical protein CTRU02_15133 [Colletotrichum truncatum]